MTLPRTGALEIILDELAPSFKERRRREKAALTSNGAANGGEVRPKDEEDRFKEITKIIDVTIAYPEGRPLDLLAIITGYMRPCTTHVHYRVFDVNDVSPPRTVLVQSCDVINIFAPQIPTETEKMRQWMYNLYYEKEDMLAKYYQTGIFPHDFHNKEASRPKEV